MDRPDLSRRAVHSREALLPIVGAATVESGCNSQRTRLATARCTRLLGVLYELS